ncbi:MAG: putative selenate ABC transporter substrate-binding protein [Spirochaetales bacterium]|nr:putative selenate ABC transporter substrate-binding protein [Spirochaetales bacterium]
MSVLFIRFKQDESRGAGEKKIQFTAIPDQDESRLTERFSQIALYLSKETGVEFVYIPVKSYAASVAAFKNGEVQLAWFGGLSGVRARRAVAGARAIAQGEEDKQFVTYFIANYRTGLTYSQQLSKELEGRTFTFGSKGSTSGRLMPEYYLRKIFNRTPGQIFKRVGYSGNHSKTIALVQSGSYEIGAVNYRVWEKEVKEGKIDLTKVSVIWKTPEYTDYNWTIRPDVTEDFGTDFIDIVQNALLSLENRDILDTFPRKSFIKADNSMYDAILETGLAIGIFDE